MGGKREKSGLRLKAARWRASLDRYRGPNIVGDPPALPGILKENFALV
jgi:hypothetical protein